MDEWDLEDIWHIRYPEKKSYTFRRGSYSSRLDYFLTSKHLASCINKADSTFIPSTDHALIYIHLDLRPETPRGLGFWRLNPELLDDSLYVSEMIYPSVLDPTTGNFFGGNHLGMV